MPSILDQFDTVDMDAFIDEMLRDDYEDTIGYCNSGSISEQSIQYILTNDVNN
jgi:hypothetical protein